jgi:hypothetical protein
MSEETKDGGPAFPVPYSNESDGPTMMPTDGMTLLDYFAGKAMQGDWSCQDDTNGVGMFTPQTSDEVLDRSAKLYYRMAAAMLRARP